MLRRHCRGLGAIAGAGSSTDGDTERASPKPASTTPAAEAKSKSGSDDESWQARVVRCEESFDGRFFFHLDNGEVWKQVKADRKSYKDCDFPITVTRDWFGYKMSTEDSKRPIRISRIR